VLWSLGIMADRQDGRAAAGKSLQCLTCQSNKRGHQCGDSSAKRACWRDAMTANDARRAWGNDTSRSAWATVDLSAEMDKQDLAIHTDGAGEWDST
jgi:hypothetical protein